MKTKLTAFCAVAALLLLAACGMKPEKHYQTMRTNLLARNFQAADEFLEKAKTKVYSEDNRLLYYMDKGGIRLENIGS